ncbi:MAG TPA: vitamin K epoxide reductase family protein, partial [Myxococcus sp.]|nr:vitamin K epoxide reductase family protein [Myxococcus sp.]
GLVALAVLAQPPGLRWRAGAVAGLTALGLAAALTAAAWTRGSKALGLCGMGGRLDCDSVLLSDWAWVGGIPLSGLGTAFFGASLLMQAAAALGGSAAPLWLAGAFFLAAMPVSVGLVAVQVVMKRFCTLCMTVHAVDVAGAALFVLGVWPVLPGPPPGLLPAALLWLLLFGLLLALAVPTLLRDDADAQEVQRAHVRLLRSPLATLAQFQSRPVVPVDGAAVGALLGPPEAPHTLVVLVHPSCQVCGPVVDGLPGLVEASAGTLRAFVAVAPRLEDPRDTALCEVLASAGAAWGGDVLLQLYRAVKQDLPRWMEAKDVAAELATAAGLDAAELARRRDVGGARVRGATALRAHALGFPALFLDGRRCEAPMAHLEAWCTRPQLRALLDAANSRTNDTHPEGAETP